MAGQEILNPDTVVRTRPAQLPALGNPLSGLRDFSNQPAVKRALPGIALIGAAGLALGAYWALQTPTQVPVFSGLADSDKAAIAEALQVSGIAYSLDASTGAVQVDEDQMYKARMILAGQGLPKAAPAGDSLIASLPMGSSRAVEGETLRSAREADLARTIEAIDAVKSARIHLATPEPSAFVRDAAAPAASIMLTLQQGRSLSDAQVGAIRHLVASSVPGMQPEQVAIVDQSGALLSQSNDNGDDPNFLLKTRIEDRYRQGLTALLAPVLGTGNFSVEVNADVDMSESQSTRETYPKDDRALRREEGNNRSAADDPAPAIGIPGALSNQPPLASQLSTTAPPLQSPVTPSAQGTSEQNFERSYDVGREISVTHNPQGRLTRLSVAVALRDAQKGKSRSAAEIAALSDLVKGAIGFDQARGDVVAISARKFVEAQAAPTNWMDAPWLMPLVRQVGGIFAALLVLLFVGRPLLKIVRAKSANAGEQDALSDASTARDTKSDPLQVTLDMIESAPSYETRANLVRAFVGQDSARAAIVVRQLMKGNQNDR